MESIDPVDVEPAPWETLRQRHGNLANFIPGDIAGPAMPVLFVHLEEECPAERIGAAVDWAMKHNGLARSIHLVMPAKVSSRVDSALKLMQVVVDRLPSKGKGVKDPYGANRPIAVSIIDPARGTKKQLAGP